MNKKNIEPTNKCGFVRYRATIAERKAVERLAKQDGIKMSEFMRQLVRQEVARRDNAALVAQVAQMREALEAIMHNLGVPQPGYPVPIAHAYNIAKAAIAKATGDNDED